MNRPLYETQDDLDNEGRVKEAIQKKWGVGLFKLPISYGLDYACSRDGIIEAFVEIKVRTNEMHRYPTYMISASKLMKATSLNDISGLRSFLVVSWSDATGYIDLLKGMGLGGLRIGGRVDRGDPADIEPMAHLPIKDFSLLGAKENPALDSDQEVMG